ncbi:Methyl-accepting chemotaxis protein II [Gemmata sp. SH-PL17]|uniref:methyl-accepting chemotaxis protein n=1 Tax=Gemmata sp. SH-PL17 TaxID=1630693 RepID=UPI00078D5928|nr:methyl-accepting chemotaxis protein [Gemmata sp. SH-PL17]AMV28036.1 Methyl-accepting chemotaxis protein II [Gemmata sp. SH-PL17]
MLRLVSRVNIGPRLIAGFLIVTVACFMVGLRGLAANAETNTALDNTSGNLLPSVINLDTIRTAAVAAQRSERTLVLAVMRKDMKRCQDLYGRIDEGWRDIDKGMSAYAVLPMEDEEAGLYRELVAALAAWKVDCDTIVRHAKAGDAKAAEEACMREWASSAGKLNSTLTQMMNVQQKMAERERTTSRERYVALRAEMWIVLGVVTAAAIGLGFLLSASVTRPLGDTVRVLETVAHGDLTPTAAVTTRDEVGRMAVALNTAIVALRDAEVQKREAAEREARETAAREREKAEQQRRELEKEHAEAAERDRVAAELRAKVDQMLVGVNALAAGDFTQQVPDLGTDAVGQMARSLNKAILSVRTALEGVREVSVQLADASGQLSSATEEISMGAQDQASSLEETASSLEEITATVKQNSDSAQQARQLASSSKEVAEKGGQVVGNAVGAMSAINESSKKIADIITTIDEIAFQTNLLALNAAVEAARAGEQGRGFAVVASEVRNLAQRSATAAKEIKGLIEDSVKKVDAGTELVNRSGSTLGDIVTSVARVTAIITEIAGASKEQSVGIDQVNKAVSQMDTVTQRNAAQTEELSATAQTLTDQAGQLRDLVARFKLSEEHAVPKSTRGRGPAPKSRPVSARAAVGSSDDGFAEF